MITRRLKVKENLRRSYTSFPVHIEDWNIRELRYLVSRDDFEFGRIVIISVIALLKCWRTMAHHASCRSS